MPRVVDRWTVGYRAGARNLTPAPGSAPLDLEPLCLAGDLEIESAGQQRNRRALGGHGGRADAGVRGAWGSVQSTITSPLARTICGLISSVTLSHCGW